VCGKGVFGGGGGVGGEVVVGGVKGARFCGRFLFLFFPFYLCRWFWSFFLFPFFVLVVFCIYSCFVISGGFVFHCEGVVWRVGGCLDVGWGWGWGGGGVGGFFFFFVCFFCFFFVGFFFFLFFFFVFFFVFAVLVLMRDNRRVEERKVAQDRTSTIRPQYLEGRYYRISQRPATARMCRSSSPLTLHPALRQR